MALYHKWNVENGFAYVLQFFSLISDGLGGVHHLAAFRPTTENYITTRSISTVIGKKVILIKSCNGVILWNIIWGCLGQFTIHRPYFSPPHGFLPGYRELHPNKAKYFRISYWNSEAEESPIKEFQIFPPNIGRLMRGHRDLLDGRLRRQLLTIWKPNIFGKFF